MSETTAPSTPVTEAQSGGVNGAWPGRISVLIAVLCTAILGGGTLSGAAAEANTSATVPSVNSGTDEAAIGYVAYWDQSRAVQSVTNAGESLTEVSPSWYAPAPDGSIVAQESAKVDDSATAVASLRTHGARVIPAIANYRNKDWDSATISAIMADPSKRARHADQIRRLAVERDYDGIDIDYEHLAAKDRGPFTQFVSTLAAALHSEGKVLSVTLHPKSSEPGPQPKNQAQDYAALGRVADQVRIMLYDYHWDTSAAGPLAPMPWVRTVMTWASSQVPPEKLVLGLGTYGYDWVGKNGVSLTWSEIIQRQKANKATLRYDSKAQAAWFSYTDRSGRLHQVWFENARSIAAKRALVKELHLGGIHYWRLGGEDPTIWSTS